VNALGMRGWPRAHRRGAAALAVARRHPRHVVLFGFVAGLLLGPLAPTAPLAAALGAAALAGRVPAGLIAAIAVLAGAALADARLSALGPGRLPALVGQRIDARAVVLEPLRRRSDGSAAGRVRLTHLVPPGSAAGAPLHETAVVRLADGLPPPGVRVGSEVAFRGIVAALGFADGYQRRRGAHAAVDAGGLRATGHARGGLAGTLDSARERASHGLGAGLPPPEAALLRGLVLGQDEAIDADVRADFERAGLAHLLAVSGQNVLLLCMLVFALGVLFDVPLRARLAAAVILVAIYVPLAGAGPSIQRAGVMGVAGLVAALAGRPGSRWYALGLAAAVTLALNPHAAGEPGWQLSFAAVAGLLAAVPRLRHALARRRVPGPVADIIAVTGAATLATAPLLALHFEQVSLASLPANLLAAPAVAPVMWLGMLAMAAAQVAPGLAVLPNLLCAPLLGYLEWTADTAAGVPLAAVDVRLGGPLGLLGAYLALAAGVAGVLRGRRWLRDRSSIGSRAPRAPVRGHRALGAVALTLVAILIVAVVVSRPQAGSGLVAGELVVSFLDVGQGDATLLQRDGIAVLVDTGPPGGPILRRLRESGVRRLDLLVLTHAQTDHEGMAPEVIAAHRPRLVLDGGVGWPTTVQRALPAALAEVGGRRVTARAGQVLRVGALRFRVLWPPAPGPEWRPEGDPNDRALVAHVQDGAFDLLLPADAESDVTAALDLPRVEALKVAHHGSADEGLPALLERMTPEVAAIEVGEDNAYGHPTPSTLGALRTVPHLIRTDRDGTVRLRVAGGQMEIERG